MRDVFAAVAALGLLIVAASLATTLQAYRRRRLRARDSERALGRTVIAEIPAADDLTLFSEDAARFYYGERSIDKDLIAAVRVLINGSPIAAYVSRLNACKFCEMTHSAFAALQLDEDWALVDAVKDDPSGPREDRLPRRDARPPWRSRDSG